MPTAFDGRTVQEGPRIGRINAGLTCLNSPLRAELCRSQVDAGRQVSWPILPSMASQCVRASAS